jgi:hypothetical protein
MAHDEISHAEDISYDCLSLVLTFKFNRIY